MTTQPCKKCNKRFNVLVKGTCQRCDPDAWAYHFKKLYSVKENSGVTFGGRKSK